MATTIKTEKTSSWADESEDLFENEKANNSGWNKSSAWGSKGAQEAAKRDSNYDKDFPTVGEKGKGQVSREKERRNKEDKIEKDDYYQHDDRAEQREASHYHERETSHYHERDSHYEGRRDSSRDRNDRYQSRKNYNNNNRRDRDSHREPREPRDPVPFPDAPPFTAFVGNLPFDVKDSELKSFFEKAECDVVGVRLMFSKDTGKPKGFGYVEFQSLDSLKNAVSLNGESLLERPLKIDVAESRPTDDRKSWKNNSSPNRSKNDKEYERSEATPNDEQEPKQRKKLELLPRTVANTSSAESYRANKENPFGEARPRDENEILKKKEEERKQREKVPSTEDLAKKEERKEVTTDKPKDFREDRPKYNEKPREDRRRDYDRGPRYNDDDRKGFRKDHRDDRSSKRDDRTQPPAHDKPRTAAKKEEERAEPAKVVSNKNAFSALEEEYD